MRKFIIKIGLIGFGSIGERHLRNIIELYPGIDICVLTKRKDVSKKYPNVKFINSKAKFFKQNCNVYFITNETEKHAKTVIDCLRYKPRAIFLEKPLSHNIRDIDKIRDELKKTNTIFFIAYCLQFFKPLQELKRIIKSDVLGKIFAMRIIAGKDVRTWRDRDYSKTYSSKIRGGGVILDFIHEINYPGWLVSERLSFVNGIYGRIKLPLGAEDFAQSNYVTPRGILVSIHQDYLQTPGMRICEVFGEKGTAIWSRTLRRGSEENNLQVSLLHKTKNKKIIAGGNDMYIAELSFFMQLIIKGESYSNFEESVLDIYNAELLKKNGIKIKN